MNDAKSDILNFLNSGSSQISILEFIFHIVIALGMGAGQVLVTLCGSIFVLLLIFLRKLSKSNEVIQNLSLTIVKPGSDFDYRPVIDKLKEFSTQLELRRLDENENSTEISVFVRFKNFESLLESKKAIQSMNSKILF